MKTSITLIVLLSIWFSRSLAFHAIKNPHPFVIDTQFLRTSRNQNTASFKGLPVLLQQQQGYRDQSSLQSFLQTLRQRLTDERTQQQAILAQTRNQCQDEEKVRSEAVETGSDAYTRSQKKLTICTSEQGKAEGLRDLADNALVIYRKERDSLEANRETQKEVYQSRRDKLADVQKQLDVALEFVEEAASQAKEIKAPEFVQLTNGLLRSSIKTGHSHMVLPIYTKLLEMHTKSSFDADEIQNVRNLLQELKTNAGESIVKLDDQEQKDQQDYDARHQSVADLIARLEKQSSDSKAYATNMATCVSQETSISELAQDKVERNKDLLEVSRVLCQESENEYEQSEKARNKQQSIVNAIEAAVSKLAKAFEQDTAPQVGNIIDLKVI